MFNFIVNVSSCESVTTARIFDGDVTSVFCFMNVPSGLDTVGGVLVAGESVRTNFTQHYHSNAKPHAWDTDNYRVHA